MKALCGVVLLLGCQRAATERLPLAAYLDEPRDLAMPREVWNRVVVPPFTPLYDDYARSFAPPALGGEPRVTRRHFAGDPALTPNQARARWLLPALFPSEVVAGVDAVFVPDGERWYALVGIDRIVRARVDAMDASCGETIDVPAPSKTCRDAAFAVASATLRTDAARFQHACAIAKTACVKSSP